MIGDTTKELSETQFLMHVARLEKKVFELHRQNEELEREVSSLIRKNAQLTRDLSLARKP